MIIPAAERISNVEEYYFSRNNRRLEKLRNEGTEIINLGIGSPDLAPDSQVIETLASEARKPNVHGYQPYVGIAELRSAYTEWYKRWYNVDVCPNGEVLPLIGSKEGIMHITMAFVNPGDKVLVPNPSYPTYAAVAKMVGGEVISYKLHEELGWQPDFDELEKMDLSGVKLMWVNFPNMPTGAPATQELMAKIVDFGIRHNILICNDNPYSFILHRERISIMSEPRAKECCIELNSMSKAHNMAGWRFGVAIADKEVISTILKVKSNMDSGVFRPMQSAAVAALQLGKEWFAQLNEIYTERQHYAFRILERLGCTFNRKQGGLFVWAQVPKQYASGEELSDKILYATGVFITPGFIFGTQGNRFVRISLCAPKEVFAKALKKIEEIEQ